MRYKGKICEKGPSADPIAWVCKALVPPVRTRHRSMIVKARYWYNARNRACCAFGIEPGQVECAAQEDMGDIRKEDKGNGTAG